MKKLLPIFIVMMICFAFTACKDEQLQEPMQSSSDMYETTSSNISETTEEVQTNSYSSGSVLFTTEYEVVDYVENAIIVSKNDGLLYGVLDNNGNVIIPISYDSIEFLNKEDYIEGYCDIYFKAIYENIGYIFDLNANEIIRSDIGLGYADIALKEDIKETTVFFYEITEDEYKFYNKEGNHLGSCPKKYQYETKTFSTLKFLNNNYFICSDSDGVGVLLCNYKGDKIQKIEGVLSAIEVIGNKQSNTCYSYFAGATRSNVISDEYIKLEIDINGDIVNRQTFTYVEYRIDEEEMHKQNNPQKYNLYQSNSTWKLEDLQGNKLYDDRYYSKLYADGEHECILLTDEDNYVTVVGRNGNRYIGSGVLEYQSQNIYLLGFNNKQRILGLYESKNSIVITVNTSNGTALYYYE